MTDGSQWVTVKRVSELAESLPLIEESGKNKYMIMVLKGLKTKNNCVGNG
jgi:hypothetical protein